jgi:hypothetical protein
MSIRIVLAAPVLAFASASVVAQTTINVPADYPSIQQAINASADGDTVLVAAGTYYEQIDFGSHQVTVISAAGPETTIIDATFLGPVVTFGAASTRQAVLQGFTITRGAGQTFAGGVRVSQGSPTIRGNIVSGNLGEGFGNGISIQFSSALVIGNTVTRNENDSEVSGGGGGGGISVLGDPCGNSSCGAEIIGNLIDDNSTDRFIWGGGIYINGGGYAKIIGNTISNNTAPSQGGGIALINEVNAQIENNVIVGNSAPDKGGGIYMSVPSGARGPFIINNTIADNSAPAGSTIYAIGFDLSSRIINNILVATPGSSALECDATYDSHPPIVIANDAFASGGGVAYAGLCASTAGTSGNISAQPIFNADSYRLAFGSPGIDAGMNSFATQTVDILGAPRIADGDLNGTAIIDMGAYEWADLVFASGFEP